MTDTEALWRLSELPHDPAERALIRAAADEIERLRKLNATLVKHDGDAEVVCNSYAEENQRFHDEIERLRAALKPFATQNGGRHGGRLTDAELDAAIGRARDAAHGAPKSIAGSESIAWAMRSREYLALLDERDRRGNT